MRIHPPTKSVWYLCCAALRRSISEVHCLNPCVCNRLIQPATTFRREMRARFSRWANLFQRKNLCLSPCTLIHACVILQIVFNNFGLPEVAWMQKKAVTTLLVVDHKLCIVSSVSEQCEVLRSGFEQTIAVWRLPHDTANRSSPSKLTTPIWKRKVYVASKLLLGTSNHELQNAMHSDFS